MRFNLETIRSIVEKGLLPGVTSVIAFYLFRGNLRHIEELVPAPYGEAVAHTIIEYALSTVVGAAFFVGSLWDTLAAVVLIFSLCALTLWEVLQKQAHPTTVFLTVDGLLLITITVLLLMLIRLSRKIDLGWAEEARREEEEDPLNPFDLPLIPLDDIEKAGSVALIYVAISLVTSALSGLTVRTLLGSSNSVSVAVACGTLVTLIAVLMTSLRERRSG